MKPIFTIHGGEYLVGSYIEENFKKFNIWVPSKDTGVDLLVTNSKNSKAVTLQVKFSKDYSVTHMESAFQDKFKAWGWWTLRWDKMRTSKADLWVFVMQSFGLKTIECIVVPPRKLLQKLRRIHGKRELIQSYLWVTNNNKCWETRGLNKAGRIALTYGSFSDRQRDFSTFLNNWKPMKDKLK